MLKPGRDNHQQSFWCVQMQLLMLLLLQHVKLVSCCMLNMVMLESLALSVGLTCVSSHVGYIGAAMRVFSSTEVCSNILSCECNITSSSFSSNNATSSAALQVVADNMKVRGIKLALTTPNTAQKCVIVDNRQLCKFPCAQAGAFCVC